MVCFQKFYVFVYYFYGVDRFRIFCYLDGGVRIGFNWIFNEFYIDLVKNILFYVSNLYFVRKKIVGYIFMFNW